MPIVPDTKDWTWVLGRQCPECGYDAAATTREAVPRLIRDNAAAWQAALRGRDPADLRTRPREDRWSVVEYACHVRDVYRIYDQRLALMLDQDDPVFDNWDQDATAVTARYQQQDPEVVLGQLGQAAERIAGHFAGLAPAQWERTGTRSDGARFSVDSFTRYLVHDPVHHLHDIAG
jgi:DinB family protein